MYLGLFSGLRRFVQSGKPVFGTCAGCIMLSDHVSSLLGGGDNSRETSLSTLQSEEIYEEKHIGGMDINTCRNFFGRQTKSSMIIAKSSHPEFSEFPCIFIRAPAIISAGPSVTILATITRDGTETIVAARQGNVLGTCFHPEISGDDRVHKYFLRMIDNYISSLD